MASVDRTGFSVTPNTDIFTGFDTSITGDHSYIHQGKAFSAMGLFSLNANASYVLQLTTGAVGFVHLRPAMISSSASCVTITTIEAPVFTAGTAGTSINRNRNSLTASGVNYRYAATYTSGGTVLDMMVAGGGTEGKGGGQQQGAEHEIVLKPSTTYLIQISNPAAGATTAIVFNLFWYEELNG
jgi:hypothetical protein